MGKMIINSFSLAKENPEIKEWIFLNIKNRRREMREKLAEYAHNQWSGWMEYLFSKCYTVYLKPTLQEPDGEAHLVIPKWAVDRWKRQMQTPYNDLSEEEKESDRKEADGMIAILTK